MDRISQDRWRVIQAPMILPQHPPPLLPNGQPSAPGSLEAFGRMVEVQARVLTLSDAFLVLGAITAAMMVVVVVLPQRILPPRLQLAKK